MSKTLAASALGLAFLIGACVATPEPTVEVDLSDVDCICGQPLEAIEGCPHPLCIAGERNPDNPDCVCGPIEFDGEGDR